MTLVSQRRLALHAKAIVASGWFTSWAIAAAIWPAAVRLVTRASSVWVARNLSCASLLSVMSIIVPMNISVLSGARAAELWPQITVPSLRRYCLTTA